jgi:hypothetical protein
MKSGILYVQGQSELHSETVSKTNKEKKERSGRKEGKKRRRGRERKI